jgi:twitching motility protein PilT
MQSLDQALADLVKSNVVTKEDALMRTSNPVKLQQSLQFQPEESKIQSRG